MKKFILNHAPVFLQNLFISLYNSHLYRGRHSGDYRKFRSYYANAEKLSADKIELEVANRLANFLSFVVKNSRWYESCRGKPLHEFPFLEKTDLLNNLEKISTIKEERAIVSLRGGTTGASMKVLYDPRDMQERFAVLDHFRSKYGYELGEKVAWFSGKDLVRPKDLERGNCFRDDYINKIRFFSTFHISEKNFESYWSAFKDYSPKYIVGFPSSVYDLCCMALERNLTYPGVVEVFFPTAETVLQSHRDVIGKVFGCALADQYASSEGAPFILQCEQGALHLHPLTGVFEVLDENMKPAEEGELVVTSFTTHGTPLVRYRVGDRVRLAPKSQVCKCGSPFQIVEYIDGRSSDFIFSRENGRVNLGNISNCTKDVSGIRCFQISQDQENRVEVRLVASPAFDENQRDVFERALRQRLGKEMKIEIFQVDEISREKSGKFRIVKNSLASKSSGYAKV